MDSEGYRTRKRAFRRRLGRVSLVRPLVLISSDAISLTLALGLAVFLKAQMQPRVSLAPYLKLWPFIFVFFCSYWMSGLYSRLALSQPEDLERGAACSCCIFLSLSAATLSLRGGAKFLTVTLVVCILLNLLFMPLLRELCRNLFSHHLGWGYQAVIFGAGEQAMALVDRSRLDKGTGITPVAIVDPSVAGSSYLCGLPIRRSIREACDHLDGMTPAYGILTVEAASSLEMIRLLESPDSIIFSRMVLVSNPLAMSSMWAIPLGKRIRLRLSGKPRTRTIHYQLSKRVLDLVLSSVLLLIILPVFLPVALAIRFDSDGPMFFGHKRLGRNGRHFIAWKFRTMHSDGNRILNEFLQSDAAAKEEWLRQGKLRHDPRITRIGAFLRATSIDELPQLWNVLRGEMSLVGPRPIVDGEVHHYGDDYDLYSQVQGGVTGMWQVSGRSSTTYRERVMLDTFYASNWTIWLDLAILLRTLGAVLMRKGAY